MDRRERGTRGVRGTVRRRRACLGILAAAWVAGCDGNCNPPAPSADVPAGTAAADATATDDGGAGGGRPICGSTTPGSGQPGAAVAGGCIRGSWAEGDTVRSFLGIRYAAAPTGPLRWKKPQPVKAYGSNVQARHFGPSCPQHAYNTLVDDYLDTDEDCLSLNVWAPATPPAAGAPVLVFFHGGGHYMGGTNAREITGPKLAKQGVVVVTANYRLGVLGYLAHPDLLALGRDGANFGLQDQDTVLRWVRDHVSAFGGDPANVTLAGQSAGGISACYHLRRAYQDGGAEPRLFRRVILQSGSCFENPVVRDVAVAQGQLLFDLVCPKPDTSLPWDPWECMRYKDFRDIYRVLPTKRGLVWGEGADWTPWVDGTWVPHRLGHPLALLDAGADVQVLLGSVEWEGSLIRLLLQLDNYADLPATKDPDAYEAWVRDVFGWEIGDRILAQYPRKPQGAKTQDQWEEVMGLFAFTCPIRRDAEALRTVGIRSWLYRFVHRSGFESTFMGHRAYHTADLPFTFSMPPSEESGIPADQMPLANLLTAAWARFAGTGDPNGTADGWVPWAAQQASPPAGTDPHQRLALPLSAGTDFETACRKFWDQAGMPHP